MLFCFNNKEEKKKKSRTDALVVLGSDWHNANGTVLKLQKCNEQVKLFGCIKIFRVVKTAIGWNEFQKYFVILTRIKQYLMKFVMHTYITPSK